MPYDTLDEWIRTENSNDHSVDDQVWLADWAVRNDLFVSEENEKRTREITEPTEDSVDYDPTTLLENLEEIDVFEKIEPTGGRKYIKSERTGEMFFTPDNEDFPPLLAEEISRLIEDLQEEVVEEPPLPDGGEDSIRVIAAEVLDVKPEEIEEELLGEDDPVEQMNMYDRIVQAIKSHDEVQRSGNYDELGWRNMANRWRLSEQAERIAR